MLGGKPIIAALFGPEFLAAYTPLLVLIFVPVIGVIGFPLVPMLYALGRAGGPLRAKIIASLAFFVTLAPLSWRFGVVGAAIALVLASLVNVVVLLVQLRGEYRRVRAK